jgi:hypothetical protein
MFKSLVKLSCLWLNLQLWFLQEMVDFLVDVWEQEGLYERR